MPRRVPKYERATVLTVVRSSHAAVVALVRRPDVVAAVGPTSATGWTAVWSEDVTPDWFGVPFVAVRETPGGVELAVYDGVDCSSVCLLDGAQQRPAVAGLGRCLAALFSSDEDRLTAALASFDGDGHTLVSLLDSHLALPELEELPPTDGVTLFRGGCEFAEFAATMCGPARLLSCGDAWQVVVPVADAVLLDLAAGLSAVARRRDRILVLWVDGGGGGFSVWRRGDVAATWTWRGRWTHVLPIELEEQAHGEAVTALRAVRADVDTVALRALLRRDAPALEVLNELLTLLDAPMVSIEVLSERDVAGRGRLIEREGPVRAVAKQASARAPPTSRSARAAAVVYAVATAVMALVSMLMTALGIAVILTEGRVVGDSASTEEDWWWVAVFGVLTLILVPSAVFRLKWSLRARRGERSEC